MIDSSNCNDHAQTSTKTIFKGLEGVPFPNRPSFETVLRNSSTGPSDFSCFTLTGPVLQLLQPKYKQGTVRVISYENSHKVRYNSPNFGT